tara:strand:- start:558 stop:1502 length:945 start_codon:yes stop_codon:yes gene_type:complete
MKKAFLFPGQGSQKIGMGKELSDNFDVAKKVFEEVDEALEFKLSDLIWNGEIDKLTLTENAQPAIMANSMAIWYTLKSEGYLIENNCVVAGHSLGEYSALCAAGSLSLSQTAKLLRLRGRAMQNAVKLELGAMAAIIGLDFDQVSKVIEEAKKVEYCEIANYNEPNQIVISGFKKAILLSIEIAKKYGAKRCILLNVSAPFHCELMKPAAEIMKKELDDCKIAKPSCPIIMNVDAKLHNDKDNIKNNLYKQITDMVRWKEIIEKINSLNFQYSFEIGNGRTLSSFVRKISPELKCEAISDIKNINAFFEDKNYD